MGIFSLFKKSNTLYFPGCVTYFKFPENFELYKKIFNKLGISFELIDKQVCCGLPALDAGYDQVARKLARNLAWVTEAKRLKITHPSHSTSQIAKLIHDNEKLNFFGKKSETIRKVITPALSKA